MTHLWLKKVGAQNYMCVDISQSPCPTILGSGIAGVCRRGWQYWLDGAGAPRGRIIKEGATPDDDPEAFYGSQDMTLWFKRTETPGFATPPINVSRSPCPTVMAGGIAGGNCSQYFLEEDGTPTMNDTTKPPYRVPTMAEIREIPHNGFDAVSTFSGCGGSSLGYRMAGFRVLWASEFIDAARDSYRANAADYTVLDGRDIRDVKPEDILAAAGKGVGEIDIFDGSPPCASFSTAGKRSEGWDTVKKYSDKSQRTDDLFDEYVRLIAGTRPRTFVAENVSGLVKGVAIGYFNTILTALRSLGYKVEARLLDAQWLGVPQMRQRIIFVGVREDLGIAPAHPSPFPHRYSVADACPWIVRVASNSGGQKLMQSAAEPCPTVKAHTRPNTPMFGGADFIEASPPIEADSSMDGYATGAEWDRIDNEKNPTRPFGQSDKYFQLVRPDPAGPCPTVTAAGGNPGLASVAHPLEKRKFSIAELRRICAFPDDFVLTGSYAQQWERMGRAVPPLMMRAVAEAIRDRVLIPARAAGKI